MLSSQNRAADLEIFQIPCLQDNYGYLIRDPETGTTAAIDTPVGGGDREGARRRAAGNSTSSSIPTITPITPAATSNSRRRPAAASSGRGRTPRAFPAST